VAYSANKLGVDAIVVTPLGTAPRKLSGVVGKSPHVTVIEHGTDFDASLVRCFRPHCSCFVA
jgi:threonine dehydratase